MAGVEDPIIQRIIREAVEAGIRVYQQSNPASAPGAPGPAGPSGPPGPPGQDAASNGSSSPRFQASDIGFFDPFYDGKSSDTAPGMEHTGKDTYFRDVTVFIDRIKDVARVKGPELLRSNL